MGLLFNVSACFCFAVIVTLNFSIGSYLTVKTSTDSKIQRHSLQLPPLGEKDHNTLVFVHVSILFQSDFI